MKYQSTDQFAIQPLCQDRFIFQSTPINPDKYWGEGGDKGAG